MKASVGNPDSNSIFVVSLLTAALAAQTVCLAAENAVGPVKPDKPSMIPVSEPSNPVSYNPKNLRRLDFKVQGKSCAVCLMGIQKKVKAMPGVVKIAVMLKRPYGALVIYDSTKVTASKILQKARAEDKEVKVVEPTDFAIEKVPTILIPLYGVPKTAQPPSD